MRNSKEIERLGCRMQKVKEMRCLDCKDEPNNKEAIWYPTLS